MSISQFAKELKKAADNGLGYTLENCEITYDPYIDKEFCLTNSGDKEFEWDAVIKDINFVDTTTMRLYNCKFGANLDATTYSKFTPTIGFSNCTFGDLELDSISTRIYIEKIIAKAVDLRDMRSTEIHIDSSKINNLNVWDIGSIWIEHSDIGISTFNGKIHTLSISNNNFHKIKLCNSNWGNGSDISRVVIRDNIIKTLSNNAPRYDEWAVLLLSERNEMIYGRLNFSCILIGSEAKNNTNISKISELYIQNNVLSYDQKKEIDKDSIFKYKPHMSSYVTDKTIKELNQKEYIIDTTWSFEEKREFLWDYMRNNDSLKIKNGEFSISYTELYKNERGYASGRFDLNIYGLEIEALTIYNNTLSSFNFSDNRILKRMLIKNTFADSLTQMEKNILPEPLAVNIDSSVIFNLGFYYDKKSILPNKEFEIEDTIFLKKEFLYELENSIPQLRQFINIFDYNGSNLRKIAIMKLKDLQTNIHSMNYHLNPNIERWFNWKGAKFIRWYSDYGTNPFKALLYCFWSMLYFAIFYFFFYSDWDKIDRGFLIKRFNSVMDYFTTEKRIQDFYSSTHDKEMTTFTEFKNTLEKNKIYMPSMLSSLAKPIYQISLLRYKLLNFSYKKAEFMAGRKWIDLEKKEKYWIGTLTFFLTINYIIYLVFIRALNSIVLSINAFSTLGFGQIPVRGFTKYVAIIEGFIGWFLLSVFIVSLLSQMMSI